MLRRPYCGNDSNWNQPCLRSSHWKSESVSRVSTIKASLTFLVALFGDLGSDIPHGRGAETQYGPLRRLDDRSWKLGAARPDGQPATADLDDLETRLAAEQLGRFLYRFQAQTTAGAAAFAELLPQPPGRGGQPLGDEGQGPIQHRREDLRAAMPPHRADADLPDPLAAQAVLLAEFLQRVPAVAVPAVISGHDLPVAARGGGGEDLQQLLFQGQLRQLFDRAADLSHLLLEPQGIGGIDPPPEHLLNQLAHGVGLGVGGPQQRAQPRIAELDRAATRGSPPGPRPPW